MKTLILAAVVAFSLGAQEAAPPPEQPSDGGWRRFGNGAPAEAPQDRPGPMVQPGPMAQPALPVQPMSPPPATLTVPAGTWITVRLDQPLSSDHNQSGDAFTATLAQPIVANGRVIARRGQTVAGAVAEAEKAGHAKGVSHLSIQITGLTLVDGRQVTAKTSLIERRGDTSVGRDVGAIGATTGVGAAIGAAADGGFGAGMGAIAGAAVSTIGVLATRGKPTVIYPETLLTFRIEAPLAISTEGAEAAFQPVTQQDYASPNGLHQAPRPRLAVPPVPPPYYYDGPGPYFYRPYYPFYGPSFFFYGRGRRW